MILLKNNYYEEDEKLFSTGNDELDDILEEVYYSGLEDGYDYAQKEFGAKSKILGAVAPGAWQGKEAAKYGYDNEEDYKKVRGKYAALGLFTPGTATFVKHQARKMAEEGKSTEEIREFLEGKGKYADQMTKRKAVGIGEVLTGGLGGLTTVAATGEGVYDALVNDEKRKKFKKSDKKDKD